jgi:lysozyme family protein
MSIFRSTFNQTIQGQLKVRQDALSQRTPQAIKYLNSRNSWVRMSSAVNVSGNSDLAKQYIMLGGTLNGDGKLKSSIGGADQAYSNVSPSGNKYGYTNGKFSTAGTAGIRPMPGITSIDIKSKSAYGSLREVVVNFQCWSIQQLEDLELLYMRPGYTALVEWGWVPYLDNENKFQTNPSFYDIINDPKANREQIFFDLFKKAKDHNGNYDAMYGYVKNYQWNARPDGGYDCQTTIISIGEIIESLKVNYVDYNSLNGSDRDARGIFNGGIAGEFNKHYSKNIIAGICYELYNYACNTPAKGRELNLRDTDGTYIELQAVNNSSISSDNAPDNITQRNWNCYISLKSLFNIFNKHVIISDGTKTAENGTKLSNPIVELSLYQNTYEGDGSELLCTAHPLQISVDPSTCIIKSPLWQGGVVQSAAEKGAVANPNIVQYDVSSNINYKEKLSIILNSTSDVVLKNIKELVVVNNTVDTNRVKELINTFYQNIDKISISNGDTTQTIKEFTGEQNPTFAGTIEKIGFTTGPSAGNNNTLVGLFPDNQQIANQTNTTVVIDASVIKNVLNPSGGVSVLETEVQNAANQLIEEKKKIVQGNKQSVNNLAYLQALKLRDYFKDDVYSEVGVLSAIYINLNYLYKLAVSTELASKDKKEKNEINLYTYLKNMIYGVQSAIGNVSNFEIHVDPIDNKARIIDVNFTEYSTKTNIFELQLHNQKSTVRSYNLQSQIFPEQGAIIAIGSQVKGGQMGIQNNTMIDFNRNLEDRIMPRKLTPSEILKANTDSSPTEKQLSSALSTIIKFFAEDKKAGQVDKNSYNNYAVASEYRNALKDIIVYFQSITNSPSKNRNIIPVKLSIEMDGIGGLVIGHLFTIPQDLLPKGYKFNIGDVGNKLVQTVTGISHTISKGDWVTKIDALNFIIGNPATKLLFKDIDLTEVFIETFSNVSGKSNIPSKETYQSNFDSAKTNNEAEAKRIALKIISNQSRYSNIASRTNVPYYVIGIIHNREGNMAFDVDLKDGTKLSKLGYSDSYFDSFAEKALNEKFENGPYNFNSIPSILKAIEAYNGFGYTIDSVNINAPYLWSGTDKYTSGKFTSDNHYEADATDKQMGAVPIIKELQKLGVKIP